jgi:hypothetical protein
MVLAAVGAILALGVPASMANVFIDDNFNGYVPGDLVPQGGWDTHSGTGYPVQVLDGSMCYCPPDPPGNWIKLEQGASSRQDVYKSLGVTMGDGDKFYAGFCVVVEGDENSGDEYFAHFKNPATYYAAKTAVCNFTSTGFQFGLVNGGGSTVTDYYPGEYAYGTCHRVITSYEFDTGISEMWIDPDCDLGEEGNDKISGSWYSGTDVVAYAFRQGYGNGGDPDSVQYVDNLIVATTWDEACCGCVPEPASLLMLALGAALIRRR